MTDATIVSDHSNLSSTATKLAGKQETDICWQLVKQGAPLIDVRNPDEFALGHLPNAINVPLTELAQWLRAHKAKQQQFVVYCGAGIRAQKGCDIFEAEGFSCAVNAGAMKDLLCCESLNN
ncbi:MULTISPECIES: rhodanese-like domain-containing protein [unclassified Shewanella]|uniref:rhodanese-like domain-containing protein n=1 Tax=unclassified Shewanella TaxID=196818 RepID=UPI000C830CBB|nr:rhodanese-like domain-containing protein [Shewanella sp. 10N.286.51.B7]PMG78988.1 sulfurtransferase [Shewanella sp. 10N.286.51.B7]